MIGCVDAAREKRGVDGGEGRDERRGALGSRDVNATPPYWLSSFKLQESAWAGSNSLESKGGTDTHGEEFGRRRSSLRSAFE